VARKISQREKRFLLLGAATVVLFLAGKWFVLPFFRYAMGASEVIDGKISIVTAYQSIVAREDVLREENRGLEKALEGYRPSLLSSATPPLAAADLEASIKDLAGRAGLAIQSKKILKHIARESFIEIPVQVVATGNVENVRDFVVLLESSEVFIAIRELHLRPLPKRKAPRGGRGRGTAKVTGDEIQATMTIAGLIPT